MARTDAHRPSAINPQEYHFVACDYYGAAGAIDMLCDRQRFQDHMLQTGGKFAVHENNGTCHICGARAMYVAKFHHQPSNTYITTGMDCAEKLSIGDPIAFKNFKKRVAAGRKMHKGKAKAQQLLADACLSACWDIYTCESYPNDIMPKQEAIVTDVVGKLIRYGSISEGQKGLLVKLLAQIAERPAQEAKRAAEQAAAADVPVTEARVQVKGIVLSTRTDETQFGFVTKMLVQHESGYKLWGTAPSSLLDGNQLKGATVEFSARVQRSDKDSKFGFFSRPTQAIRS